MKRKVYPGRLSGKILAPPSKSASHRALICAALSFKKSILHGAGSSEDIDATKNALRAFGFSVLEEGEALILNTGGRVPPRGAVKADCGESGSTLRFLIPVAAALGIRCEFTGRGRLPERPIDVYTRPEALKGVSIKGGGGLPLEISGQLQAGEYEVDVSKSSQFLSGYLMALGLLGKESRIRLIGEFQSKPYADLTIEWMKRFGAFVKEEQGGYRVGGTGYAPCEAEIEGDYSQAAFYLCAGAMGSEIEVDRLLQNSLQGDREIVSVLRRFGAEILTGRDWVKAGGGALKACRIDGKDIPDIIPVLCVTALFAQGVTEIYNTQRLRLKESDRIHSTIETIRRLGGAASYEDGTIRIVGGRPLKGGVEAESFGDHRIAMSLAVAALRCENPVVICGAECVRKSYPHFFEDFISLGGRADVVSLG